MKQLFLLLSIFSIMLPLNAQMEEEIFDFEFEGFTLNGVLNQPPSRAPKGIVLIVHGAGRTDAIARRMYLDVRSEMTKAGYATYMWDKMGCGRSEGAFDYNQPVANSAQEVIAAIKALPAKGVPGADKIGLWGISRAGWINPLVIQEYKDIKFWISVSGVDAKENFGYLLRENLRIEGMPEDSVELIVQEWKMGNALVHAGADYQMAQAATSNLQQNAFMQRFNNGRVPSEEAYYNFQKTFRLQAFDEESSLPIYIEDFDAILASVNCPVLAIFGEKDKNVDWRKTKALYERTIASNTNLTIRTFPDGNHNLFQCKTGGFYEMQDDGLPWNRAEGYLKSMSDWLKVKELLILEK